MSRPSLRRPPRAALVVTAAVLAVAIIGCGPAGFALGAQAPEPPGVASTSEPPPAPPQPVGAPGAPGSMTIEQTLSDEAQRRTIAFDGLAFLTGNLGADSFFPPGKVADWWGFQHLRDNDPSAMGHNTDFLTSAALNVLSVLSARQRARLVALAREQVDEINAYGYRRFALMTAFRRLRSGDLPAGAAGLDRRAVMAYSARLYRLDGAISLDRARVMGRMLAGLSADQRAHLAGMAGTGMSSWPVATEPDDLRQLTRDEKVAVMTYAGDLFSWYAGDVTADVYFCPERQGTYFGSFYLKDAPAVGNPGYSISTSLTSDLGQAFLDVLTPQQAGRIEALVESQRAALTTIVQTREEVAQQLRRFIEGGTADRAVVQALMTRYGRLDGDISFRYARAFVAIGGTLSDSQATALAALRARAIGELTPAGGFLFSQEIPLPSVRGTDSLFGVGGASPSVTP